MQATLESTTEVQLIGHSFETPLGDMFAVAGEEGLVLLDFVQGDSIDSRLARLGGSVSRSGRHPVLTLLKQELAEYFSGDRTDFSVPLASTGTDFELRTWDYLRSIPFGQTRSYGQQARALGDASLARAVGRANGANRIAIVIPCHRVIGADGSLTGFASGIERKRWLLDHERAIAGTGLFDRALSTR